MNPLLSNGVEIKSAAATTGAGTSDVNGSEIDMQNYEGVLFIAKFGTAASDNTIKAQQSAEQGGASPDVYSDLAGTKVGVGSSDELVWLDIYRPRERFLRMVALRGTSTTLDWAVAIKYGPRKGPVDNTTAGTIHGEAHRSPAEGTA